MTYLQTAKNFLKDLNTIGCTEEEIQELERKLNAFLPESYKEFLLWMGKDSGGFLKGSDFLYPKIIELQTWSQELLAENRVEIEKGFLYLTFFIHQGYSLYCFSLTDHNDPTVYRYLEGDDSNLRCLNVPFSKWLEVEAFLHNQYTKV